jgi:hypothetical protein
MATFLQDPDNEFHKLDTLDKRLFFEVLEKYEKSIEMWIDHVADEYSRKGIQIDVYKFKNETHRFRSFIDGEDRLG